MTTTDAVNADGIECAPKGLPFHVDPEDSTGYYLPKGSVIRFTKKHSPDEIRRGVVRYVYWFDGPIVGVTTEECDESLFIEFGDSILERLT